MDDRPPPLPEPKPLLGRTFLILFFSPIGSMVLAAAVAQIGDKNGSGQGIGLILSLLSLLAMFVCSILCAVIVGKKKGGGWGFLTFLIVQVFYIAAGCAGCAAVMGHMDFK